MKQNYLFIIGLILFITLIVIIFNIKLINPYDVNDDGKVNSKDLLDLRLYLINKGDD